MPLTESLPDHVKQDLDRAERLEWQTLFWLAIIVAAMYWAMGGSQAFKTAWIEDVLSLMAPAFFLISRRIETKGEQPGFPFGFQRIGTLAFFLAAVALCAIGGFLLYEGLHALITGAHPTVGSRQYFGHQVWMGWIMIAVLTFSVIPPVLLGRKKRKVARRLHDSVLFVDAETNAADWQTGLASILGIVGIAAGFWWADAVMASLISLSVVKDGYGALKASTISLLDGLPRSVDSHEVEDEVTELRRRLEQKFPGARAQIRGTGRYLRARVEPCGARKLEDNIAESYLENDSWRLIELSQALREKRGPDE